MNLLAMDRAAFGALYRLANLPAAQARPAWLDTLDLQALRARPDWRALVQRDPLASRVLQRLGSRFDWERAVRCDGLALLAGLGPRGLIALVDGMGQLLQLAAALGRPDAGLRLNRLLARHADLRLPARLEGWALPALQHEGSAAAHGCAWLQAWLDAWSPTFWPRLRLRLPPRWALRPPPLPAPPADPLPPALQALLACRRVRRDGED
jgi:hypothetical protein